MPQNNEEKKETPLSAEEIARHRDLMNEQRGEASEEQKELQRRLDAYGTEFAPKNQG